MKHRLRGAAHRALIVALAFVLGVSTIALAAQAQTPTETGAWIGNVCSDNPGDRTFLECAKAKCWDLWQDQQSSAAYWECMAYAEANRHGHAI